MAQTPAALRDDKDVVPNSRLLWELQTVNEIADGISRSLELDDVLTGALQRVVRAFDALGASVHLRDDRTGRYDATASVVSAPGGQIWDAAMVGICAEVIADRRAVVAGELAIGEPGAGAVVASAISLPLLAGDELLGTLNVAAARPRRFDTADQRLLAVIAGQVVVAVQNARLHDSVRRGKQEWERTFDAISDPIAVFDSAGQVLRANTALAALIGRPVTDIRGVTCTEIGLCGGGCPRCSVGRAHLRGAMNRAEVTRAGDDIFSVTTFPVEAGPDGASVVQVAKNVTEEIRSARRLQQLSNELGAANFELKATVERLKSTQAQLLQAEKLSAIGQLVAGVAHELNNPLTSVIGYAQLLESELRAGEERPAQDLANDLQRIAEESGRAARIVRNLLAFARRQTAERVSQDVTELMTRVLSLRSYEFRLNGVDLETHFEAGLPAVVADGSQLQQALLNLVLNAERAMRGRPDRRLSVGARHDRAAGAVELFVSDTGHGIEHANLTRVFDPFFTTREVGEGTGLGLSICYGIVHDHGGQISVTSKLQVGTTFSILLPARLDPPVDASADILVARADQGERDFVAAALSSWGYGVSTASRTEAALARYRQGGLRALLIDRPLLAADPQGWRAARAGDATRAPLIVMSMADDGETGWYGQSEARVVLTPPFQLRALRAALAEVVDERHSA